MKPQPKAPERKCPQCNKPSMGFVKGLRSFIEFCEEHSPYTKQKNGIWQYHGVPEQ